MSAVGYKTFFSGKWHVDAHIETQFDTVANLRPRMPRDHFPFTEIMAMRARHNDDPPRDNLLALFPPGYNRPLGPNDDSWSPTDSTYGGYWAGGRHWSEVVADDTTDFLRVASARPAPWFMYLAFNAPHDPRQAPVPSRNCTT